MLYFAILDEKNNCTSVTMINGSKIIPISDLNSKYIGTNYNEITNTFEEQTATDAGSDV